MTKRSHLSALCAIGLLAIGSPVVADDGDVQRARVLLEEARMFGVTPVTGESAGQIDTEREERRRDDREVFNENQEQWEKILEAQSLN